MRPRDLHILPSAKYLLLEHIIHTSVMFYLMNYNILSNAQFGFRKNYSAKLQLIQTTHDLALNLNNKGQTDVILLGFNKAFDKIPPEHLILNRLEPIMLKIYLLFLPELPKILIHYSFYSHSTTSYSFFILLCQ